MSESLPFPDISQDIRIHDTPNKEIVITHMIHNTFVETVKFSSNFTNRKYVFSQKIYFYKHRIFD